MSRREMALLSIGAGYEVRLREQIGFRISFNQGGTMSVSSSGSKSPIEKTAERMRKRIENGQMNPHILKGIEIACLGLIEKADSPHKKTMWMGFMESARIAGAGLPS